MTDPQAILVAGDWHGDLPHAEFIMERAKHQDVQAIVQVGDYGYWEHMDDGAFLDGCSQLAVDNDIPIYWIDGNHENHTMLRALYGPGGDRHKPTPEGFWEIRPGLFYIPRGTRWTWSGVRMMGLGGAYSVDKGWRVERTAKLIHQATYWDDNYQYEGEFDLWWPEEEITDDELAYALRDDTQVDLLFTHDKPLSSTPGWNRKNLPLCVPNQGKVQTVVEQLRVNMLVHGHLHYRYMDAVDNKTDRPCVVHGLDCNAEAAGDPYQSWMRVDLLIDPLNTGSRYEGLEMDDA